MAYTEIDRSSEYFNTLTYTGDGVSPKSITGVGFQPDFVWLKNRGTTNYHLLQDVIRGVTSTNVLSSNDTTAEPSFTNIGFISSFNSDGFTATSSGGSLAVLNASANNYVAWNFKANGAGVSNTDGSITSTVSASTTSGFSIVSYTGTGANATVGHGLSSAPKMIIIKGRSSSFDWTVGNSNLGWNKYLMLHSTNAEATDTTVFNNTAPTSSVFSLGTNVQQNASGATFIAYCFAEKKGFSKAFKYTGNGSSDGTYIHLGFRPAWVMVKASSSAQDWVIRDNKRDIDNPTQKRLSPNLSDAEVSVTADFDFLSNGIKARGTGLNFNGSGVTYIGIAFAEHPFVTSSSIPTTAR